MSPSAIRIHPRRCSRSPPLTPKRCAASEKGCVVVPGIKAVYETDILFKNRFLIDQALGGMGWVEAPIPEWTSSQDASHAAPICKCAIPASSAARGQCSFAFYELRHRVPARSWGHAQSRSLAGHTDQHGLRAGVSGPKGPGAGGKEYRLHSFGHSRLPG